MKPSDLDALDALIDRVQRRTNAPAPSSGEVDLKTTRLVGELQRLAQQVPHRPGFVQALERKLLDQVDRPVPVGSAFDAPEDAPLVRRTPKQVHRSQARTHISGSWHDDRACRGPDGRSHRCGRADLAAA